MPTDKSSADALLDEIVAAVEAAAHHRHRRDRRRRPLGGRLRDRRGAVGRQRAAPGRPGAPDAVRAPRPAGVRGQRRELRRDRRGPRRRRAAWSSTTSSCTRWAPGSAAVWSWAGGRTAARPAPPPRWATRSSAMRLDDGPPEPQRTLPPARLARGARRGARARRDRRPRRPASTRRARWAGSPPRGRGHGGARGAAAKEGDPEAVAAVRLLGERLGVGIANALNIFDPEVVAIGGGVSVAGDLLLEPGDRGRAAPRASGRRRGDGDPAVPLRDEGGACAARR